MENRWRFGSVKDCKGAFEKVPNESLSISWQHHYIAIEKSLQPLPVISKGCAMVQENWSVPQHPVPSACSLIATNSNRPPDPSNPREMRSKTGCLAQQPASGCSTATQGKAATTRGDLQQAANLNP